MLKNTESLDLQSLKARRSQLENLIQTHQYAANNYMQRGLDGLAQFESNEASRYQVMLDRVQYRILSLLVRS